MKIKFQITFFIYLALTLFSTLSYAVDNKLSVSVPPFPPFDSFDFHPQCKGVGILAIEKVTKKLQTKLELAIYPYSRMLNSLKTGELDLALIFKNDTLNDATLYIGPLSHSKVFVLTQQGITVREYNDLYNIGRIAVIRDVQFNNRFDQDEGLTKVNVNSYRQAIRLLKVNQISAVIGSTIGLEYALLQENMDADMLTNAFYLGTKELGLHLSKKSPFIAKLAVFEQGVKETYQADLIYQLYKEQLSHCAYFDRSAKPTKHAAGSR